MNGNAQTINTALLTSCEEMSAALANYRRIIENRAATGNARPLTDIEIAIAYNATDMCGRARKAIAAARES